MDTLFQFPTGWNSTHQKRDRNQIQAEFQFPTGWNSTIRLEFAAALKFVSIPNGMEFYFLLRLVELFEIRVSIPNGMEFYKVSLIVKFRQLDVSIPNGMEFYNEMIERGFLQR